MRIGRDALGTPIGDHGYPSRPDLTDSLAVVARAPAFMYPPGGYRDSQGRWMEFRDDTLNGQADDDLLEGNDDNDELMGDGGTDVCDGGAGLDSLVINATIAACETLIGFP